MNRPRAKVPAAAPSSPAQSPQGASAGISAGTLRCRRQLCLFAGAPLRHKAERVAADALKDLRIRLLQPHGLQQHRLESFQRAGLLYNPLPARKLAARMAFCHLRLLSFQALMHVWDGQEREAFVVSELDQIAAFSSGWPPLCGGAKGGPHPARAVSERGGAEPRALLREALLHVLEGRPRVVTGTRTALHEP